MRIIKNQDIIERQSQNIIKSEMSNIAMVLQVDQVLVNYFSIDADLSVRMNGSKAVYDYIGPDSTVMFNLIENLPIAGLDSTIYSSEYDDETGMNTEMTAEATIFSNTIQPKAGDCFMLNASSKPAIFQVTNFRKVLIRDMPTIAIEFHLLSNSIEKIEQLNNQVHEKSIFTVSNIGTDTNLVIKKESYFQLKSHIKTYIDLIEMYNYNFYDGVRGTFLFKGMINSLGNNCDVIDAVLLKFMFEEGIIVYDDVITYANNNYPNSIERIFIDDPKTVDNFIYKKSILYGIITKSKIKLNNRYQEYLDENPQIAKFTGTNYYIIESYSDKLIEFDFSEDFSIFDDAFIKALKENNIDGMTPIKAAIVAYFNNEKIDFENLEITDDRSIENFYLIPIILYIYKKYIISLK